MLAEAVLAALKGFADEVSTWTNQGSLISISGHIAQIENAVATDVHAGETAAKAVLAELYGAFHGHAVTPIADAPAAVVPVAEPIPAPVAEAPVPAPVEPVAVPVAVDPTVAPSTTPEASSAPSSTPSTSTDPAAPAA